MSGDDFGNRLLDEEDDGDKMKLKNEFAVTTRATQTKNFSLRVIAFYKYFNEESFFVAVQPNRKFIFSNDFLFSQI